MIVTENTTSAEKYKLVLEMEEANKEFEYSKAKTEIEYVHVDGALKTVIDKENKKVTAYFPSNANMDNRKIDVYISEGSELAAIIETANLSSPVVLPVYNEKIKKYDLWEITGTYGETVSDYKEGWTTRTDKRNAIVKTQTGSIMLKPDVLPAMNAKLPGNDETIRIAFKPITPNKINKFNIIFAAASAKELVTDVYSEKNRRYEIGVENDTATLYAVTESKKTAIATAPMPIQYNKVNNLTIHISDEGANSRIQVKLNEMAVFDVLSPYGMRNGYLGFLSNNVLIEVINAESGLDLR